MYSIEKNRIPYILGCLRIFLLSLSVLLPVKVSAVSGADGFGVPERLVFDLTWTGIKAGTATMDIKYDKEEIHIISTARSANWISSFYPVEDRIESAMIKTPDFFIGLPRHYKVNLREGRHLRNKEVVFDHVRQKALYTDHLKPEKGEVDIQKNTLDPLSAFYFIRTLQMEVGKPLYVRLFDSRKMWDVEVQVLRKEKIDTVLGSFNTIVIKPLLASEGIFSRRGDMHIWLTDDKKRIPVKMQTKVAVGSITATLVGGSY